MPEKNIIHKRGFISSLIRFLEPTRYSKFYTFQQVFKGIITWSNPFVHVLFIQLIIGAIEGSNQSLFGTYMLYYLIYIIAYDFIHAVTYSWGLFVMIPEMRKLIGNRYMSKYIHLDNTVTEKIGTGKAISVIDKGIESWALGLSSGIWNGSGLIASFIISLFYLSTIHYSASIAFILIFFMSLVFAGIMNAKMLEIRSMRNEQEHLYTKHLVKNIMNKFEVMQNSQSTSEERILSKYADGAKFFNIKMSPYFHAFHHAPSFILTLLKLGFLYYVSSFIFSGELGISTFVGLFGIMLILEGTVIRFIEFFKQFSRDFSMIEYLWNFFDTTPQIQGYEAGDTFKHTSGKIELKNLNYGYIPEKPIFKDFTLDIPGNQITALVGPSGGGKSTLVKLISGYIRQDNGDILIDNQNLRKVSLKSYYRDIGYLTQEPSVFDGSVKENLLYTVTKDPSKKHLEEVIKLAHCEFIYDLPKGLDTEIGERGVKLSGGQKQRLAIAKIFLKDPKIIILDEPTSALDSMSEQKITEAMQNLFKGRTVIIIAHRLQTVKHADDIIVIEGGEIIERGTHTSLIRKKGYYKKMLDLQSGF